MPSAGQARPLSQPYKGPKSDADALQPPYPQPPMQQSTTGNFNCLIPTWQLLRRSLLKIDNIKEYAHLASSLVLLSNGLVDVVA